LSLNRFGRVLTLTTWGESHGTAIGCVLDGVPPRLPLTEADIQPALDRRRPGQSRFTTQRREPDQVRILSGVFDGRTTGTPIAMMIDNADQRSKDYSEIAERYRPGHADYTYDAKYGIRDYRGGGRSSARETANRVAAGAIAGRILGPAIRIRAGLVEMGGLAVDPQRCDWSTVDANPFFCPDPGAVDAWAAHLDATRRQGDSLGGVIEVIAEGVPPGWGAPIYAKLDADLAAAMMSINAVKGVEIGAGFQAARLSGADNADEMVPGRAGPDFLSNRAGGVLGGISTGQPIIVRLAIKPTSSILTPRRSVTRSGETVEVVTKGRHDPCVAIRGVPVAEAMMALVLADHGLLHRGQCGETGSAPELTSA